MTTTDRPRARPAATAKVITTGAALAVTGALVTGMAIDRPEPSPPPPPQIVVVIRRSDVAATATPAPAAIAPAPVAATGGS